MSIAKIKFTKTTSLSKFIQEMSIGEETIIPYKFYTEMQIRKCCADQRKKGLVLTTSKKDSINGIKVTRIA